MEKKVTGRQRRESARKFIENQKPKCPFINITVSQDFLEQWNKAMQLYMHENVSIHGNKGT